MKFTKMHGIGNDYVYVNCFEESVSNKEETARFISDRHFGIGSDGLILINPSNHADFEMEMYNSDGSRAEMCGNGIRCVGKYVYDHKMTDKRCISVETLAGIKYLDLEIENDKVVTIKVNMGAPILEPKQIPVQSAKYPVIKEIICIDEKEYLMTCVSMGNPHAIIYMEDIKGLEIEHLGPKFENHPVFPKRTNTEFVRVIDRKTVEMRVWERGAGETLACGTGACATAVACILNGLTEDRITVKLLGGVLEIYWNREENIVYMTGTATTVFDGEISI
ncbi:MAG: diaminopimelate epimerase [Lachnospiraceae bacterium]|nr:diaminopimelate epimerase [Lachnospiraceae bacterium]